MCLYIYQVNPFVCDRPCLCVTLCLSCVSETCFSVNRPGSVSSFRRRAPQSFVVLNLANSNSNHVGAQGTFHNVCACSHAGLSFVIPPEGAAEFRRFEYRKLEFESRRRTGHLS